MILVDTHNHILPGIDDGAKNLEETIEMCKIAEQEGVKFIVATPHYIKGEYDSTPLEIERLVDLVNEELVKNAIEVKVVSGHEVFVDPDIPKLLQSKSLSTLGGSKYLLIELPMHSIPNYMEDLLYSIRLKGYVPIIAHPERNTEIIENPNTMFRFIELGALAQLTTWSILGNYGKKVQETAVTLLEHNMYSLLATDAHSSGKRKSKFEKAINMVQETVGVERTNTLISNALLVIEDKDIQVLPPTMVQKPKGLISLIKRIVNK